MSLVGTRPPTVDEWDKYELHHRARLATKPGLTGMWQVSGRSNITDFLLIIRFFVYHPLIKRFHNPLRAVPQLIPREGSASKGNTIRGKSVAVYYCFSGLSI